MAVIPIVRYAREIRWKGESLKLAQFPEIRAYLDACLSQQAEAQDDLKLTRDNKLMLELVSGMMELVKIKADELRIDYDVEPPKLDSQALQIAGQDEIATWARWMKDDQALKHPKMRKKRLITLGVKSGAKRALFEQLMPYLDKMTAYYAGRENFIKRLEKSGELERRRAEIKTLKTISAGLKRLEREIRERIENPAPRTISVPWELVRGGEGIAKQLNAYLDSVERKYRARKFDATRLKSVMKLGPSHCALGSGEFDGYVGFFFPKSGKVVLECAWEGNALYLFNEDRWIALSRLTKTELLSSHSQELERIIHDPQGRWFSRLQRRIRR